MCFKLKTVPVGLVGFIIYIKLVFYVIFVAKSYKFISKFYYFFNLYEIVFRFKAGQTS